MKNLIVLLILVMLFGDVILRAQEADQYKQEYRGTIEYNPAEYGQDGYKLKIKVKGYLDAFFGEPVYFHLAKAEKMGTQIYLDGKWYSESEFEENDVDQISIGVIDYSLGIYDGQYRVTTIYAINVIDFDIPGSPEWNEIFPGLNEASAKALYKKGFQIRDIQLQDLDELQFGFYGVKESLKKEKEYQDLQKRASEAERQGNDEEAISLFESASRVDTKSNDGSAERNAQRIKDELAEIERKSNYDAIVNEARALENVGDLDGAADKYREAIPYADDETEIDRRIDDLNSRNQESKDAVSAGDRAKANGDLDAAMTHYEEAQRLNPNLSSLDQKIDATKLAIQERNLAKWQNEKQRNEEEQDRIHQEQFAAHTATLSMLSVLLFQDMGSDKPKNLFNNKGSLFRAGFGYEVRTVPVFEDQTSEFYDGNNTTYIDKLTDASMVTLNVNAALEYWPLRNDVIELGAIANGHYGMGLQGESVYGYQIGGEVHIGYKAVKAVYGYSTGLMAGSYFYENYDEIGGNLNLTHSGGMHLPNTSVWAGVKFMMNLKRSKGELKMLYTQTIPNEIEYHIGSGLSLEFSSSNRIKMALDYSWDFPRTFDSYLDFDQFDNYDMTFDGTRFGVRFIRIFDTYKKS